MAKPGKEKQLIYCIKGKRMASHPMGEWYCDCSAPKPEKAPVSSPPVRSPPVRDVTSDVTVSSRDVTGPKAQAAARARAYRERQKAEHGTTSDPGAAGRMRAYRARQREVQT